MGNSYKKINRFSKKKEEKLVANKKTWQYRYAEIYIDATRCTNCT